MKCILVIVLLLPSFLWAQENVRKKNSIQIIKGTGVGHHILETSQQVDPTVSMNWIESSKPGLNYRFGLDYQRQIIGGLSMKIGSRFSMWSINDISINTNCYFNCCWWGCNYYMEAQKLEQYYIEMPIALQYKFGKNKLQFYIEVGANPMFNIMRDDSETDQDRFSVAVHVGAGLSYQFSNNWSLFGQLSSRIQTKELFIQNIRHGSLNYGYLYEVGLELGVECAF